MRRICLICVVMLAGCAPRAYTPITSFAVEPVINVQRAASTELTLGIRPVEAARPYRQPIAYKDPGLVLGTFEYFEWAELPRDIVTRAISDAVDQAGIYQNVGLAALMGRPDHTLTGQLRKFELNRATQPWTAEVETSLTLRKTLEPEAIWSDTLAARVPLVTNDITALPEAMSRAVADIAEAAAKAIAAR